MDGPELERAQKLFKQILIDCAKTGKTDAPTDTELARLNDWLAGRYMFVDVSKGSSMVRGGRRPAFPYWRSAAARSTDLIPLCY